MLTKNRIARTVLLGLVALSVLMIAFAINTPKPVQADTKNPCEGYICIDDPNDAHVFSCMLTGNYAWDCTNWCWYGTSGVGYCAGVSQCQPYCPW
jgi:hypothetical protein